MIVAVDAVGGDHYPYNPVKGGLDALDNDADLEVILLGPEDVIKEELQGKDYEAERLHIEDAPEIIGMEEAPSQAVKSKRNSSIVRGLNLHAEGECNAFISTGNTGALLAASTLILGKLKGVIRPTVATYFPTLNGYRLLVDAGANLELKPEMYAQFGLMSSIYCREIMEVDHPQIALLNVGEEEEKGTDGLKDAYRAMSDLPNFIGNVEGRDILPGKADVVVCDGFTGNVLLKFGESVPEMLEILVGRAIKESDLDQEQKQRLLSIIESALVDFDYENVGGLPFLGVDGISMVGHGGSGPRAIKNMILNGAEASRAHLNEKIVQSLTDR